MEQPKLQVYATDFGKKKDDATLFFVIFLYKEYRGWGIGMALMQEILCILKRRGYQQASTAVQKENYILWSAVYRKAVDYAFSQEE